MKTTTNRVQKFVKKSSSTKKALKSTIDFPTYVEKVQKKAYELFEKRGGQPGSDWQDWFDAEQIIEQELCVCE